MPEPKSAQDTGSDDPGLGMDSWRALERVDRSYLLRREVRYPFPSLRPDTSIRFRHQRRVSGSFRGIPTLRRNGRP